MSGRSSGVSGPARWELLLRPGTAEETRAVGAQLACSLGAGDLLILSGELGAGKTTFTQGLGEGLGVRPGVISPTFVLVRIHPNLADGPRPGGPALVHADAYRLAGGAELDDVDLESTLEGAVTVVEWGRGRAEHLAESRLDIELARGGHSADVGSLESLDFTADEDEPRTLRLRGFGPRWAIPPALDGALEAPVVETFPAEGPAGVSAAAPDMETEETP